MAKVKIQGHASGTGVLTVTAPNTSTDRTITLPDSTGTLATTADVPSSITDNGDATAITINSNENVGIGVVPEVTHSSHDALQLGGNGVWSSYGTQGASGEMDFQHNAYYAASGDDKYISTDEATKYRQGGGIHRFYTASSGSADATVSWTQRARIDSDGLKFNNDSAAANALDDYEEGNWTPTLTGSGTISHRVGKYVKIGNQIMVQGEIRSTSYNNSGSTDVKIGGLPYSSFNESNYNFAANITPITGFNSPATQGLVGYVSPNETDINLFGVNFSAGANYDFLQTGEMGTTVEVFFALHYRTN